nr:uncharacterized protein LOC125968516 [Syngnathus scovelli]
MNKRMEAAGEEESIKVQRGKSSGKGRRKVGQWSKTGGSKAGGKKGWKSKRGKGTGKECCSRPFQGERVVAVATGVQLSEWPSARRLRTEVLSGPGRPPSRSAANQSAPAPPSPPIMIGSRCLCAEASSVRTASWSFQCSAAPAHHLTHVRGQLVSKRDAAEELADQVQAPPPAADRRAQATSGDPDEEEEDEENQSSQGHNVQPDAALCLKPRRRHALDHVDDVPQASHQ